ncbi:MAG: PAS domain S-box protein [Anaerolineales bacterium]|nr:PAS domain S-box protein [Anaerolineales bacterium]
MRTVRVWGEVEQDQAGNPARVRGAAQDITERLSVDRAQSWLGAAAEFADDAIVARDLSSTITGWNRGAEKLFGYSAHEAIGQPLSMIFPPEIADERVHLSARVEHGESISQYETHRVTKDGRRIPVAMSLSPIRAPQGQITGSAAIFPRCR